MVRSHIQDTILKAIGAGLVDVVEISPAHEALQPSVSGVQSQGTGRSTVKVKERRSSMPDLQVFSTLVPVRYSNWTRSPGSRLNTRRTWPLSVR
jgi:hypothetical protein